MKNAIIAPKDIFVEKLVRGMEKHRNSGIIKNIERKKSQPPITTK
ncbi:hypothetical protein GMMP15_660041 [Candidatus Magnetomoraceae bacterium gMMP-15]